MRKDWADRYAEVIKPGGLLITLMYPLGRLRSKLSDFRDDVDVIDWTLPCPDGDREGGPPYSVHQDECVSAEQSLVAAGDAELIIFFPSPTVILRCCRPTSSEALFLNANGLAVSLLTRGVRFPLCRRVYQETPTKTNHPGREVIAIWKRFVRT